MKDTLIMLVASAVIGYLLGSISPSALVAIIKKTNLRSQNTGNLGATNTMLTCGFGWGILVLALDVTKAVGAVTIAAHLFPDRPEAGLLAGAAAVFGHVFPLYLHFHGGKGLAPFMGVVLAFNPLAFVILILIGAVLTLIVNYTAAMPMTLALFFPIAVWVRTANLSCLLISLSVGVLVVVKHWSNLVKAFRHEDRQVRGYIAQHLFHMAPKNGEAEEKRR